MHCFSLTGTGPRQKLKTVKSVLAKVGKAALLDDLELKLNRAAETATPKAKRLFWKAISDMSFEIENWIERIAEEWEVRREENG